MHRVGLLSPVAEVVRVAGNVLAEVIDGFGVGEEEDLGAHCLSKMFGDQWDCSTAETEWV